VFQRHRESTIRTALDDAGEKTRGIKIVEKGSTKGRRLCGGEDKCQG